MPKTIDSMLANHEAAEERRKVGKPVWDHTIRIKHLLTEDASDEYARTLGRQISAAIICSGWFIEAARLNPFSQLMLIVDEFEDIEDVSHFNDVFDMLYDEADADRVWIA